MKKLLLALLVNISTIAVAQTIPIGFGYADTAHYIKISNDSNGTVAPQRGTLLYISSDNLPYNPSITIDAYRTGVLGSFIRGRAASGTISSPTAATANFTLMGIGGDGYGTDSFHNVSVASMLLKSEGTMSNTSAPTYISFMTTPTASTTAVERLRIKSTGVINIAGLNSVGFMQTDANGDVSSPNAATTKTNLSLNNVTNESKATMFTNAVFTGTFDVANGAIANADLANGAVANLSGTNTGDQTTVSGNAGTATTLATPRTINGSSFDGSTAIVTDNDLLAYTALGSPLLAQTVNQRLEFANTSTNLVDGQIKFTAVYLPKAATLTGIKVYVRVLGSYTGDNNNRVGLYSYSGGNLTLVASSSNNATLWQSSANAIQTVPFSSTYAATAGIYFVGILYNNSAVVTNPALASGVAANNLVMVSTAYGFTNSAKLHGTANGTDLTTPIAMSAITASVIPTWVALY